MDGERSDRSPMLSAVASTAVMGAANSPLPLGGFLLGALVAEPRVGDRCAVAGRGGEAVLRLRLGNPGVGIEITDPIALF